MDPLIADLGLAGRVALVTGAASGIGKAAAQVLAAAGAMKFVTQLVNPTGVTDAVPANNRRSGILTAPAPTK